MNRIGYDNVMTKSLSSLEASLSLKQIISNVAKCRKGQFAPSGAQFWSGCGNSFLNPWELLISGEPTHTPMTARSMTGAVINMILVVPVPHADKYYWVVMTDIGSIRLSLAGKYRIVLNIVRTGKIGVKGLFLEYDEYSDEYSPTSTHFFKSSALKISIVGQFPGILGQSRENFSKKNYGCFCAKTFEN